MNPDVGLLLILLNDWYKQSDRAMGEFSCDIRQDSVALDEAWHGWLELLGIADEPAPYEHEHGLYGYYDKED